MSCTGPLVSYNKEILYYLLKEIKILSHHWAYIFIHLFIYSLFITSLLGTTELAAITLIPTGSNPNLNHHSNPEFDEAVLGTMRDK